MSAEGIFSREIDALLERVAAQVPTKYTQTGKKKIQKKIKKTNTRARVIRTIEFAKKNQKKKKKKEEKKRNSTTHKKNRKHQAKTHTLPPLSVARPPFLSSRHPPPNRLQRHARVSKNISLTATHPPTHPLTHSLPLSLTCPRSHIWPSNILNPYCPKRRQFSSIGDHFPQNDPLNHSPTPSRTSPLTPPVTTHSLTHPRHEVETGKLPEISFFLPVESTGV